MTERRVVSKRRFVDPKKARTSLPTGKRPAKWTVMSQWTCNSCHYAGIPGDTKVCPQCGSPKEKSEEYTPSSIDAPALTAAKLTEMGVDADHSSDQYCPFCGSKSKPGTQTCPNCSANIADVARTDRRCVACGFETTLTTCPKCGISTESKMKARNTLHTSAHHYTSTVVAAAGRRVNALTIGIAALVVIVLVLVVFALWPRDKVAQVVSVEWSAEISLEAQRVVRDEGWMLPSDATLIDSYRKQSGTEQVQVGTVEDCDWQDVVVSSGSCSNEYDHTEEVCYDDGTCDRNDVYEQVCTDDVTESKYVCVDVPQYEDRPVYSTYYEYTQLRWVSVDSARASGRDNGPYWPTRPGSTREAGRRMSLLVSLQSKDGQRYTYAPSAVDEFQRFQPKTWWRIKHVFGAVVWAERNAQ